MDFAYFKVPVGLHTDTTLTGTTNTSVSTVNITIIIMIYSVGNHFTTFHTAIENCRNGVDSRRHRTPFLISCFVGVGGGTLAQ